MKPDFVFGPVSGAPAPYSSKQFVVDHTIVNPLCATHLRNAATTAAAAAAAAHKEKNTRCKPHLDAAN